MKSTKTSSTSSCSALPSIRLYCSNPPTHILTQPCISNLITQAADPRRTVASARAADAGAGNSSKNLEEEPHMGAERPVRTLGASIRIAAIISAYLLLNSSLVGAPVHSSHTVKACIDAVTAAASCIMPQHCMATSSFPAVRWLNWIVCRAEPAEQMGFGELLRLPTGESCKHAEELSTCRRWC